MGRKPTKTGAARATTRDQKRAAIIAACMAFGEALCAALLEGDEDETRRPKRTRVVPHRPSGRVELTEADLAAAREIAGRLGLAVAPEHDETPPERRRWRSR